MYINISANYKRNVEVDFFAYIHTKRMQDRKLMILAATLNKVLLIEAT